MPRMQDGSKFVTNVISLTTTGDTDVYVVPNNFSSHIENLFITNSDTSNREYSLKFFQNATSTTHILFSGHAVTGKGLEYVFTVDKPLYIHAGDKIIAAANTANTLLVGVVAEEFFDPAFK